MSYTTEEIKQHRKLWADALRSGEFLQGKGQLTDGSRFCCLGVGCVVAKRNGVPVNKAWRERKTLVEYLKPVRDWLGLADQDGTYTASGETLTGKNDSGASFNDIAYIIENMPVTGQQPKGK